jgi:hypothetical protein
MSGDSCVMSGRPTHGAEASSSRATLPASDGIAERPEQERERVNAPPAHFADVQAEQVLLSVRNMAPTLTSDERRGLSLNGRC